MGNKAGAVAEPRQLTLWPDDALPGQLPLFDRGARAGVISEDESRYCERCQAVVVRHFPADLCFHCEGVLLDFLKSRSLLPKPEPPAAEPIREPDEWFGKRPPMNVIRAASAYL